MKTYEDFQFIASLWSCRCSKILLDS